MRIIGFFIAAAVFHGAFLAVSVENRGRNVNEHLIGVVLVERSWVPPNPHSNQQPENVDSTVTDNKGFSSKVQAAELPEASSMVKKVAPPVNAVPQQKSSVDPPPAAVVDSRAAAELPEIKQASATKERPAQAASTALSNGVGSPSAAVEAAFAPTPQMQQPEQAIQRLGVSKLSGVAKTSTHPTTPQAQIQRQAQPRYGYNPAPAYPGVAIRRGWEGRVEFNVKVLSTGLVDEVRLKSSSGYDSLDKAARRAIMSWRFNPAISNGRETESWVVVPVQFVLDDRARRR